MNSMRIFWIAISAVMLVTAAFLIFEPKEELPPTESEEVEEMDQLNAKISRSLRFDQKGAKLHNDPMDRSKLSEMALALDNPRIEEREAIDNIYALLSALKMTGNKGSFPAGLNVEITNALLGDNPGKIGYLPADSPRINDNGELVDQYGTPYWIHTQSSKNINITSAGPDKILLTKDDLSYMDE